MPRKSAAAMSVVSVDVQPPSSLSEAERTVFIDTVTACDPRHFRASDMPLLNRYVETVALSDHAAGKLRDDVTKDRPSPWLTVQERLLKMLVVLSRQLRLSPMARMPNNPSRPQAGNGYAGGNVYERIALHDDTAQ